MDKWEYQNKPCCLENCVVRELCKRRTACTWEKSWSKKTSNFWHFRALEILFYFWFVPILMFLLLFKVSIFGEDHYNLTNSPNCIWNYLATSKSLDIFVTFSEIYEVYKGISGARNNRLIFCWLLSPLWGAGCLSMCDLGTTTYGHI